MKKILKLSAVFIIIISTIVIITPIHEFGHAVGCWLLGGTVHEISLIPGETYAGYTLLTLDNSTVVTDYIISSAGYIFTLLVGLLLYCITKKFNNLVSFSVYMSSIVIIFTATAQFLYTIVASAIFRFTGNGSSSDIIGTISKYPDSEMWIVLITTILYLICYTIFMSILFSSKKKLLEFVEWFEMA